MPQKRHKRKNISELSVDEFMGGSFDEGSNDNEGLTSATQSGVGNKRMKRQQKQDDQPSKSQHVRHKSLEKLKNADPEFYKFLESEDKNLLEFSDEEDDEIDENDDENVEEKSESDENDEDAEVDKIVNELEGSESDEEGPIHKPPQKLEEYEIPRDDSDESEEEVTKDDVDEGKKDVSKMEQDIVPGRLTLNMIKRWTRLLQEKPTASLLHDVVQSFKLSVARVTNTTDVSSRNVDDSSVLNALMRLCLDHMLGAILTLLRLANKTVKLDRPSQVTQSKGWKRIRVDVKSYLGDLLKVLTEITQSHTVDAILKHVLTMTTFFASFPAMSRNLLKRLVKHWSEGGDTTRVVAFLCINRLVRTNTDTLLDSTIKKMYMAYVRNCKFTSPSTLPVINFMQRTLVEIFSLVPAVTYQYAFIYIRQLAIHLRNAIVNHKAEEIAAVYNWQYVHSAQLWVRVLCALCPGNCLDPLIYPLTQTIIGVIKYARQYLDSNSEQLKPNSRFHHWKDTTPDEMRAFLALFFGMGVLRQLDLKEYWSTDEVCQTPFFPSVMPRDRFLLLLTFIHFNDNSHYVSRGQDGYDPLYKLGAVYTIITEAFTKVFYPGKNIAIDEGLVAWRGNIHFRVYNPDKPDKFGIKSYELCDSDTGYCCRYELYTGKRNDISQYGSTYDVCMRLIEPYLDLGHCLYVDNYYTSPVLFWKLYQRSTGACGTLRINRKHVPKKLKDAKLKKGETMTMTNPPLTIMRYHDKRVVNVCTTVHTSNLVATGQTDRTTKAPVMKPECIEEYNKYMGAVDRNDQMVSYECMKRRTLKWYKKVMFHIFDLAELQAYLVYKFCTPKPVLHRKFRMALVKQLVAASGVVKPIARGRPRKSAEVLQRLSDTKHFLTKIVGVGKKKKITRSCVVCVPSERQWYTSQNMPVPKRPGHESSYECRECKATLCIEPCFMLYHTVQDFSAAYRRWKESQSQEDSD